MTRSELFHHYAAAALTGLVANRLKLASVEAPGFGLDNTERGAFRRVAAYAADCAYEMMELIKEHDEHFPAE